MIPRLPPAPTASARAVLIFDGIKTSFPVAPLVHHFDGYNRRLSAHRALSDYAVLLRPLRRGFGSLSSAMGSGP